LDAPPALSKSAVNVNTSSSKTAVSACADGSLFCNQAVSARLLDAVIAISAATSSSGNESRSANTARTTIASCPAMASQRSRTSQARPILGAVATEAGVRAITSET
jgi:hypothetical protein